MNSIITLVYRNIFISIDKVTYGWQLIWPISWIYLVGFSLTGLMNNEKITINGLEVPYYAFVAVGMMVFNAMNTSEVSGSIIWKDKRNGMFLQLLTMKYNITHYIISNLITIILMGLASAAIIGIIGFPAFGNYIHFNLSTIAYFFFALVSASVFFGCMSIILSCLTKNNEQFNIITNGIHYFFTFAAATFYPLDSVPEPLRTIFLFNPMTYIMNLTREGIFGTLGSNVHLEVIIVGICTIGMFLLAIGVMKKIKH
jgi:ABC-2 type transport system permease protein